MFNRNRSQRRRSLRIESLEHRRVLAQFVVTNTNDSGGGSLSNAIDLANAMPGADEIVFDSALAGSTIPVATTLEITDSVFINGLGPGNLTIDGSGNPGRIFNVPTNANSPVVTIQSQTIQNAGGVGIFAGYYVELNVHNCVITNNARSGVFAYYSDSLSVTQTTVTGNGYGGIYAQNVPSVSISNSVISGNSGALNGGGVNSTGANDLYIYDTQITGNSASFGGGGIAMGSAIATISESTISGNQAGFDGGGVRISGSNATIEYSIIDDNSLPSYRSGVAVDARSSHVYLNDVSFSANSGFSTSAVRVRSEYSDGSLTINSATFENHDSGTYGSVISHDASGDLVLRNVSMEANSSRGVDIGGTANVSIENSSFNENAYSGDGGAFRSTTSGAVTILDSNFDGNASQAKGAGLFVSAAESLTISDSNIRGNYVASGNFVGGGLYVYDTPFTIEGSVITGNSALDGGGIHLFYGSGTIRGTRIDNNVAADLGGGIAGEPRYLTIEQSSVDGNTANRGAGIHIVRSSGLDLIDSTVDGNTVNEAGGAFFVEETEMTMLRSSVSGNTGPGAVISSSNALIRNTIIDGNDANATFSSFGGLAAFDSNVVVEESAITNNLALYNAGASVEEQGNLEIHHSTISGNSSSFQGGGIGAGGSGYLLLSNSSVIDNQSVNRGGGLYVGVVATAVINQSTVSGNTSTFGGGVFSNLLIPGYYVNIIQSTIANNFAEDEGGGIFAENSPPTIHNSILADNSSNLAWPDAYGRLEADYSLIETLPANFVDNGGNITNQDPQLQPLADNGGLTYTHLLAQNSPAVDAGANNGQSLTDQRGGFYPRVVSGAVDMGATEYDPNSPGHPDFNDDGLFNCADIDALVALIANGSYDANFDLNADGQLDLEDQDLWLSEAGWRNIGLGRSYLVGDANLDGVVDGLDFIEWNNNKFTSGSGWCGGDFNADGITDGLDFIEWNNNKFQSSPGPSANSIMSSDPSDELYRSLGGKQAVGYNPWHWVTES